VRCVAGDGALPIERVAAGRWCEPFFRLERLGDRRGLGHGRARRRRFGRRPLFFLPLAYSALAYPIKSLVAVGAMALGAYLGLAIAIGDAPRPSVWIWACTLIAATWICARQAANHDEQRRALNQLSRTDSLTECLNRRGFGEQFAIELARCRRDGSHLA
jgi:hypothetical protein